MTFAPADLVRMLLSAVIATGCLMFPGSQTGQAAPRVPKKVETSGLEFITPKTQNAIDQGLADLASRQHIDGSIGSGRYDRNVAVTALSGMAFLSAGHTPGRGKYGENVQEALEFILLHCRPNGFIKDDKNSYHGPMYGHGFATLFLAEVYGMSPRKDVRKKLEKAVELIVNTQDKDGGWRYSPKPQDADISVTVCQVMALRAARNAGIYVPKDVIQNCITYVKRSQNPDGGFRYQLRRGESRFPRSAAGVVALYSAGIYKGREVENGLKYLMRFLPQSDEFRRRDHYFYGHYYAVQAMWHAGKSYWRDWYPAIRDELLRRQLPDGAWYNDNICREYDTAMACLILQMPNNYLPIFER